MKAVAFMHIKGGVGKTTAAVNVAHIAATAGLSTLLIDMDPQGAAGYMLGVELRDGGAKRMAAAKRRLADAVIATPYPNLALLGASLAYHRLPALVDESTNKRGWFHAVLARVAKLDRFQLVVVDGAAGIAPDSAGIMHAVDLVAVPVHPSPIGCSSLAVLQRFAADQKLRTPVVGFGSMVRARRQQHQRITAELSAGATRMLAASIPQSTTIERMGELRLPLAAYSRGGVAVRSFVELTAELTRELGFDATESRITPRR